MESNALFPLFYRFLTYKRKDSSNELLHIHLYFHLCIYAHFNEIENLSKWTLKFMFIGLWLQIIWLLNWKISLNLMKQFYFQYGRHFTKPLFHCLKLLLLNLHSNQLIILLILIHHQSDFNLFINDHLVGPKLREMNWVSIFALWQEFDHLLSLKEYMHKVYRIFMILWTFIL